MGRVAKTVLPAKRHRKRFADAELKADLIAEGSIAKPRGPLFHNGLYYCQPDKTVDQMAREAIDQYMQEHGARRFAPNTTADDFNLCVFLRWRGYRVQRNNSFGNRRAPFFINEKAYSRKSFLAFVDAVRAALDLQPIGKPA